VCPTCGALVHADELKRLAADAERAATPAQAMDRWREAYRLLPEGSRQREAVAAKITALVQTVQGESAGTLPKSLEQKSAWGKVAGGAGVVVMLLAKFKFALVFLLTKGKLLLLGLTKISTLLSMFVSFGFYWSMWGWKFAAGFVLSIFVHEMGHVTMLNRLGIKSTAPMFIPGFGALITHPALPTPQEQALVGLAGPNWGLGAALACWAMGYALASPFFIALAHVGAWINLFNLTPVWQLDGSHGWGALTQLERYIVTGMIAAALFFGDHETASILWLVLICAIARLFKKDAASLPDGRTLADFVILVAALTFVCAATTR
jgi:Zn-dependent protease